MPIQALAPAVPAVQKRTTPKETTHNSFKFSLAYFQNKPERLSQILKIAKAGKHLPPFR